MKLFRVWNKAEWELDLDYASGSSSKSRFPTIHPRFQQFKSRKSFGPIFHLRNLYWTSHLENDLWGKNDKRNTKQQLLLFSADSLPCKHLCCDFDPPWVLPWAPGPLWVKGWALELGESCQSWLQCLSVAWFTRITIARSPNGKKRLQRICKK